MNEQFNFDNLRNLTVGSIDFVSPNEIKVLLETDAPQNMALNTGVPSLFPRINGFVLVPNEVGALVGIISWLGVEHSQYPKRKGFKDYDLIDLPFPLRKMAINPIGTLKRDIENGQPIYKLERGVYSFPSIGDAVILPTDQQLKSIVENDDELAFVKIGVAPIAGNAIVTINPNKLFGRHIAVLGNTGSGKSCSVAGLIRWSLEEAAKRKVSGLDKLNTRFIVLDPNGEYSNSFNDLNTDVTSFKVEMSDEEAEIFKQLKVPAWFWNSYEWSSFSIATGKTQRPILRQALRELKSGGRNKNEDQLLLFRRQLTGADNIFQALLRNPSACKQFPGTKNLHGILMSFVEDFNSFLGKFDGQDGDISATIDVFKALATSHYRKDAKGYENFDPYTNNDLNKIIASIELLLSKLGGFISYEGPDEDTPIEFAVEELPDYIEIIAKDTNALQHLEFYIMRLRTLLANSRLKQIIGNDKDVTLEKWLSENISRTVIIDLSLIPSDIIHLIVSVISRIVFEAMQRYRRMFNKVLPTVLVLEEAHNFIKRYSESEETSPTEICNQVFERIAREGRKFGLSLMISSQRPSELSATILSQCNTFLLHRIVNDRDQDLIRRLVPDNIGGLLKELPILPTGKAILLGWASPIPILVEMNVLEKKYRPKSDDPDFWEVWTGQEERKEDWESIAREWQGNTTSIPSKDNNTNNTSDPNFPF